jgi:hypothetical protein
MPKLAAPRENRRPAKVEISNAMAACVGGGREGDEGRRRLSVPRCERVGGLVALAILALSIAACPRLGSEAGSRPDAAVAPAPAPAPAPTQSPMPWAANAADVTRFADEVPYGPDAVIAHDKTAVRRSPGGAIVTTLPAGAEVVKLSARGDDDLVGFDDKKSGGRHLMGWVAQSALQDPAPPPDPTPTVTEDSGPPPPAPPEPPAPHGDKHQHHPKKPQPRHPQ